MENLYEFSRLDDMDAGFPSLYPLNKSLQEEVNRLFSKWLISCQQTNYSDPEDDITRDFRLNGQDSEYCSDSPPSQEEAFCLFKLNELQGILSPPRTKKRSKKQAQGCVFCRNNGEDEVYYKKHSLKDSEGRVTCPILRAYTCPICNANGDMAHTIKYCPQNPNPEDVAAMTILKARPNSTGQKRTRRFR